MFGKKMNYRVDPGQVKTFQYLRSIKIHLDHFRNFMRSDYHRCSLPCFRYIQVRHIMTDFDFVVLVFSYKWIQVSCSLGRTMVNVEAGTKTQFSTISSTILLGAIILYFGYWLRTLPMVSKCFFLINHHILIFSLVHSFFNRDCGSKKHLQKMHRLMS